MDPDGTGDTLFFELSADFAAVTVNPAVANQYVFAHQTSPDAPIGIYRNTTPRMNGATQIVAPTYQSIGSLQVSNDGRFVYYVADARVATGKLMKVPIGGGAPVQLDTAEAAHVSPDGNLVAYAKAATNNRAVLFVRPTTNSGAGTQITEDTYNSTFPQFSKNGSTIVFSSDKGTDGSYDLFLIPAGGGAETRITNTATTDELGASFNSNGSAVSFVVLAFDTADSGIYKTNTSGVNVQRMLLRALTNPGDTTYWTSSSGRSRATLGLMLDRMRRQR